MRKVHKWAILFLILILISGSGIIQSIFAQNLKNELQSKRKKLLAEIENTQKILKQAKAQTKESLAYLSALKKQVRNRRKLVNSLDKEVKTIDRQIGRRTLRIDTLQSDLFNLKSHVAELLRDGYMMRNQQNKLNFIFSASNFNQMVKRQRYLKSMVEYRRTQLVMIADAQTEERGLIQSLIDSRNEKLILRKQREDEENVMFLDQKEVEKLVKALKGNEEQIRLDLAVKQKAAKDLEAAIRKAIEEEIRKTKVKEERQRLELTKKRKRSKEETLLPGADVQLSKEFMNNYGKLPWPVNNGYISGIFGTHRHPELSNIQTENNGINIASTKGAIASSVFTGFVSAIVEVPGMHKTVLVKHGEYFTVYANLIEVYVNKGDEISIGQTLGLLNTAVNGITELHFELWKGSAKQNPERWLTKGI